MVTTTRRLVTGSWKADVQSLESAVARFTLDRPLSNDCEVAFFEIAGDQVTRHIRNMVFADRMG